MVKKAAKESIIQLLLLLLIIMAANIVAGFLFFRIDLTQEKRYSLSPSTKKLASDLPDQVFFKIYLDGDLPPGFIRLRNSIKETLDELRIYSDNINYEFINPSEAADQKDRVKTYKQLTEKGLYPTNLEEKENSGQSQKIIFPGALVVYKTREIPLQFLKSKMGSSAEQMLNASVENLEYEITSILRKITLETRPKIAFVYGHGELPTTKIQDAAASLSEFYVVDTIRIREQLNAFEGYKALIIAGPDSAYSEKEKFILDQFIMKGGRVLWLIDKLRINMDSLSTNPTNVAIAKELNLDDLLFNYGARINNDLVMDLQAAPIPIVTGYVGNQPKQEIFPWYYFPLISAESKNPIVHNLNAVKMEFPSSIDTIENNVTKTILLTSSKFSRIQMAPARVSLNILREPPDPKLYRTRFIPTAVLLEGIFPSNFANRLPAEIANAPEIGFRKQSDTVNKMIVVSDADVIANYVSKKGAIYPLGYDRITQQTYGNKSFILNCMDYLCDNTAILELRGKEFRLRLLDPAKMTNKETVSWVNVIVPVLLIIVFGGLFNFIRKRKFER